MCEDLADHDWIDDEADDSSVAIAFRAEHDILEKYPLEKLGEADETRSGLPRFVVRELRAFLDCGILARGFERVRCHACGVDTVVAFSCKRRGFCPSRGAQRMANTAAHSVDRVFPEASVRQWVLSLPYRLRYLLAYDPELYTGVRRIFVRAILPFLEHRAHKQGIRDGRSGAVVFVQRFDIGFRLNVHFHALFLDGVYTRPLLGEPEFHAAAPLTDDEVAELTRVLHHRILRWLRKHGRLPQTAAEDCELIPSLLSATQLPSRGALRSGKRPAPGFRRSDAASSVSSFDPASSAPISKASRCTQASVSPHPTATVSSDCAAMPRNLRSPTRDCR